MTKNPLLYGVLLLALAVFVTQCCFTVHQTQQALVLQLGDPLPEIYRPVRRCPWQEPSCRKPAHPAGHA